MRRLSTVLVVLLLAAGALLAGAYVARNPEEKPLTDADRASVREGEFVRLRHGTTWYELRGPADTVNRPPRLAVLVHGFSVPSYIWDSTVVALEGAGLQVLRYDQYGRGWSDRPDLPYDDSTHVEQLAELLDSIAPDRVVDVMGLSNGGWVVARFAARYPERVRTVTFVDPVARARELPWFLRLPGLGPVLWQVLAVPGMAEGQPGDFLHPERFPGWVERYRPQMRYEGFGRALHRTALATSQENFDSVYAAVGRTDRPVLLVWGRQDPTTPFALAEVVRRNIPGTVFVPVDSAGHLPHMERPEVVRRAMLRFLAQDGGDSAARVRVRTPPPGPAAGTGSAAGPAGT